MRLKTIFAVFLTASTMLITSVSQAVTIEVGYPYSSLFDVTFKKIYPMFRKPIQTLKSNLGQLMIITRTRQIQY